MIELDRYGSSQMGSIWSIENKYHSYLEVWRLIAIAQSREFSEFKPLVADLGKIEVPDKKAVDFLELRTKHELDAIRRYLEKRLPPESAYLLHFGCTSSDIQDNADGLRLIQANRLITNHLEETIKVLCTLVETYKSFLVVGKTHLLPAELTTLGYRFAGYLEELFHLHKKRPPVIVKGLTGACGTGSNFTTLWGEEKGRAVINHFTLCLATQGVAVSKTSTQTNHRLYEWEILNWLAALSLTFSKMHLDLRIMHSTGEVCESFSEGQTGSSAMPHKKNPIGSEKIGGLSLVVKKQADLLWEVGSRQMLERTLDDSSVRRLTFPTAYTCMEEILITSREVLKNLKINVSLLDNPDLTSSLGLTTAVWEQRKTHTIVHQEAPLGASPSLRRIVRICEQLVEVINEELS